MAQRKQQKRSETAYNRGSNEETVEKGNTQSGRSSRESARATEQKEPGGRLGCTRAGPKGPCLAAGPGTGKSYGGARKVPA